MQIKNIAIIGAGVMGRGIAQAAAQSGYDVFLTDVKKEITEDAIMAITKLLERGVEKGKVHPKEKDKILRRISIHQGVECASEADLVIEAVSEDLELKKRVFANLDTICPSHTILATNTSTLSIAGIAGATSRPEKVIGMHFFNPAPLMKLVEIVPAKSTSEETRRIVKDVVKNMGKVSIEAKDYPGFLVNRLCTPMMNEAIYLLMEGNRKEDIDTAVKLALNHPLGPIELADLCGLDVVLKTMEVLYEGFGDPKYRPCPLLRRMVEAGYLGRKTKRGFYNYS